MTSSEEPNGPYRLTKSDSSPKKFLNNKKFAYCSSLFKVKKNNPPI